MKKGDSGISMPDPKGALLGPKEKLRAFFFFFWLFWGVVIDDVVEDNDDRMHRRAHEKTSFFAQRVFLCCASAKFVVAVWLLCPRERAFLSLSLSL